MSDGSKSDCLITAPVIGNKHISYINAKNFHLLNSVLDKDHIYFINLNDWHKNNSLPGFTVKFNNGGNIIYPNTFKTTFIVPDQVFLSTPQTGAKNYPDPDNPGFASRCYSWKARLWRWPASRSRPRLIPTR